MYECLNYIPEWPVCWNLVFSLEFENLLRIHAFDFMVTFRHDGRRHFKLETPIHDS